jgi:transcriptional regulator with XRE-family HTH domain
LDLGLYQKDVAQTLGVSVDSVYLWENNLVSPLREHLTKLNEFLRDELMHDF